jgi:hypothetical protein
MDGSLACRGVAMVSITANNAGSSSLAQLLQNFASSSPSSSSPPSSSPSWQSGASENSANGASGQGNGVFLHLSDRAKAILARANEDQGVADRLQAHAHAGRRGRSDGQSNNGGPDLNQIYAQITAITAQTSDNAQTSSPIQPAVSFSNSLQAGDFSISATANAQDGSHSIVINGPNGFQLFDKVVGQGEVVGGTGLPQGLGISWSQSGNVESITLSSNSAAAANVTETSDAGTVSASAVTAQSDQLTFAVDFSTGTISSVQSDQSVTATAAESSPPTAPLSILA